MNLSLSPQTQKLIEARLRRGEYKTADDVVAAALAQLDQQEQLADFEPGELDALIKQGEDGGPSLDGEAVLAELRALRNKRKAE